MLKRVNKLTDEVINIIEKHSIKKNLKKKFIIKKHYHYHGRYYEPGIYQRTC